MGVRKLAVFLLVLSLCLEGGWAKEKGSKKGKKKGKQVFCPSQLSSEDLARVPENSTSNILNRLLLTYDPRIRPNFKGKSHFPFICLCLFRIYMCAAVLST
ncbi:Glycine receptor subunit beta [Liparis tanakae]|uniref:Glycine receptor subunit beta n=1 Tax=Liparis tanakae TaxID=230148 RepID=A0A4Z2EM27_9TELE|nr:Glycine receptor subunit beta [Liparis tanakae]